MSDLPPVERLQVIQVRPNDVIVATMPPGIGPDMTSKVGLDIAAAWPDNVVRIVSAGLEIAVYRPGEDTE